MQTVHLHSIYNALLGGEGDNMVLGGEGESKRGWEKGGEVITQLVCHLSSPGTPSTADCARAKHL